MAPVVRSTIVAFLGIGAVGSAGLAWFLFDSARAAEGRLSQLQGLPSFHRAEVGAECLVEGRVLPGRPLAGGLLAYQRIQYQARGQKVLGWETQVLRLATPHGEVEFVDPHYTFDQEFGVWWHLERTESPATVTKGAIVLRGIGEGSALIAFGTAERRDDRLVLRAHAVRAGDLPGFVATLEQRVRQGRRPLWLALASFGVCLTLAIRQGRKHWRA